MPIVSVRRCASDFGVWGRPLCATLQTVRWRCDGAFRWCISGAPDGDTPPAWSPWVQLETPVRARSPRSLSCQRAWCPCGARVEVQYNTEHRCGLRLRHLHCALSDCITDTDPLQDARPLQHCVASPPALPHSASARTARLAGRVSVALSYILAVHPAARARRHASPPLPNTSVVLQRGAGAALVVEPVQAMWGVRARFIAPTAIIAGVCRTLGMLSVHVPGATGQLATDVRSKLRAALATLGYRGPGEPHAEAAAAPGDGEALWPLCVCHVKATDEAGHLGNPLAKARVLADTDSALAEARRTFEHGWRRWAVSVASWRAAAVPQTTSQAELLATVPAPPVPLVLLITGDHTTACSVGDHTAEPVPLIAAVLGTHAPAQPVSSPDAFPGDVLVETAFLHGPAGRRSGRDAFPLALELAATAERAYDTMHRNVAEQLVAQVLQLREARAGD